MLFVYIASIFYFKITSRLGEKGNNSKKANFEKSVDKVFKVKSQLSSLINKEMKRFFSTPIFMINAGFGMVLILAVTIAISVNFDGMINNFMQGNDIEISISEIKTMMPKIFYGVVVFTSCMSVLFWGYILTRYI